MDVVKFINNILFLGAEMKVDGDKLRYFDPNCVLSKEHLEKLSMYKTEIIKLVSIGTSNIKLVPMSPGQKAMWMMYQFAPESLP